MYEFELKVDNEWSSSMRIVLGHPHRFGFRTPPPESRALDADECAYVRNQLGDM